MMNASKPTLARYASTQGAARFRTLMVRVYLDTQETFDLQKRSDGFLDKEKILWRFANEHAAPPTLVYHPKFHWIVGGCAGHVWISPVDPIVQADLLITVRVCF